MTYRHIDHRAPWYVFRGDPSLTMERHFLMGRLPLGVGTSFFGLETGFGELWAVPFAGVFLLTLVRVWTIQNRFTIEIPNEFGSQYAIKNRVADIQKKYAVQPPEIKKMIEPLVVRVYDCARAGDEESITERYRVLNKFLNEMDGPKSLKDKSDINDLKQILATREQMKREGLL